MIGTVEVAAYYKKTEQTIRAWAREFSEYLSPTANPGRGKGRTFTIEDLQVIDLIADMKERNSTYEDIHLALKSGQRGDPPALSETDLKILKASEGEKRAAFEIQALQQHIVDLQERLNRAEREASKAGELEQEKSSLQTEIKLLREQQQELKDQQEEMQRRVEAELQRNRDLAERLGHEYARGLMDALKRTGNLPGGEGEEK